MTDNNGYYSDDSSCTSNSLLERAKRNDSDAWQVLVELYAPLVYVRCRHFWHLSAPAAEDLGQEVFTAVARKLQHFQRQRPGSFRKWLRTITDNKCKDLLSKTPLATATGGSAALRAIENLREQSDLSDFHDANINEDAILMKQALKAVANEFSDRDLKIFWSIAVDERCRNDIATEWQVTDNVVYLVYSRIRKRLHDIFQELLDLDVAGESA